MKWLKWSGLPFILGLAGLLMMQPWKSRQEITYVGAVTTLSSGQINPESGLGFSMRWMAKRLHQGHFADFMEMRWAGNGGMFISYQPKRQELQCGIVGKPALHTAFNVTSEDIYRAAQQGGSFKYFQRTPQ